MKTISPSVRWLRAEATIQWTTKKNGKQSIVFGNGNAHAINFIIKNTRDGSFFSLFSLVDDWEYIFVIFLIKKLCKIKKKKKLFKNGWTFNDNFEFLKEPRTKSVWGYVLKFDSWIWNEIHYFQVSAFVICSSWSMS